MTMPMTKALKEWESRNTPKLAAEEKEIRLYGGLMFENNTKRQFINKLVRAARRLGPPPRARPIAPARAIERA